MNIFSRFVDEGRWEKSLKEISHVNFSLFYGVRPTQEQLNLSPINIFIVNEPNEYFYDHDWIIANSHAFNFILTWSSKVLNSTPNSLFSVYGESWWFDEEYTCPDVDKEFKVSFLRGNLKKLIGHTHRFEIFDRQNEIKTPIQFWEFIGDKHGDFTKTRQDKVDSFLPYQFSLCIENSSREGYFTEKITDCILNKTIPIYWGCSNIGDFYNPEGILQFNNPDEAIKIINSLTPEFYKSKSRVIEENYQKAFQYKDYTGNVAKQITEIFKYNNIL